MTYGVVRPPCVTRCICSYFSNSEQAKGNRRLRFIGRSCAAFTLSSLNPRSSILKIFSLNCSWSVGGLEAPISILQGEKGQSFSQGLVMRGMESYHKLVMAVTAGMRHSRQFYETDIISSGKEETRTTPKAFFLPFDWLWQEFSSRLLRTAATRRLVTCIKRCPSHQ